MCKEKANLEGLNHSLMVNWKTGRSIDPFRQPGSPETQSRYHVNAPIVFDADRLIENVDP